LELHPDKTRLIEFGRRFAARNRKQRGEGKPKTFTFLGFTHFCGQRISDGAFIVWRITGKKRMVAKLKDIKAELQSLKHDRTVTVGAWLRTVVLGYYQYHAVPGNTTQLRIFQRRVNWLWRSVLIRRSQRAQVRWEQLTPLLNRWVPQPRVLHPYPDARFHRKSHMRRRTYGSVRGAISNGRPYRDSNDCHPPCAENGDSESSQVQTARTCRKPDLTGAVPPCSPLTKFQDTLTRNWGRNCNWGPRFFERSFELLKVGLRSPSIRL
jgi:hypothetical protein